VLSIKNTEISANIAGTLEHHSIFFNAEIIASWFLVSWIAPKSERYSLFLEIAYLVSTWGHDPMVIKRYPRALVPTVPNDELNIPPVDCLI
jgi:hypothetical protein